MLSLTTHEPNFALLREDILQRAKKSKKKGPPDNSRNFQLLHISTLREYLALDFGATHLNSPQSTGKWDLEKIIDDFVVMCFFIGNDFLPNLPGLDIAEGALNEMFKIYKTKVLPKGYLTEGSNINFAMLEIFLRHLTKHEKDMFEIISPEMGGK
jgi:5'-3' exoribonuclease 1